MANRQDLRKDLRYITLEGTAYCFMAGAGEAYFPAFLLALGHSQVAAGLIAVLPLFLGSVLQNLAPSLLPRVGSLRTWSVGAVLLQACFVLMMAAAAWSGAVPLTGIFLIVSLYWGAGWACGPAFNTWMETVVPRSVRPRFFARRNALANLVQWGSMLAAGGLLSLGARAGRTLETFAGLFLIAALARVAGAHCMSRQSDARLPESYRVLGFAQAFQVVKNSRDGRALFYLLGAQASLQMAAPFVSPFLLGYHHLDYFPYMLVLSTMTLARIAALPVLGGFVRRLGPRSMLRLGGLGLVPVPLLWLACGTHLPAMLLIQAATGVLMAAYDLAVLMVYLEAIPAGDRTSVLTRFSLVHTLAMLAGSGLGSGLLLLLGQGWVGYAVVFGLSALSRVLALRLLRLVPESVPAAPPVSARPVVLVPLPPARPPRPEGRGLVLDLEAPAEPVGAGRQTTPSMQ